MLGWMAHVVGFKESVVLYLHGANLNADASLSYR